MWAFFRALFGTDFMADLDCLRGGPGALLLHVDFPMTSALGVASVHPVLFVLLEMMTTVGFYSACVAIYKLLDVYQDKTFRRVAVVAILFFFMCGTSRVTAVWLVGST
jgi:hypothetical protein